LWLILEKEAPPQLQHIEYREKFYNTRPRERLNILKKTRFLHLDTFYEILFAHQHLWNWFWGIWKVEFIIVNRFFSWPKLQVSSFAYPFFIAILHFYMIGNDWRMGISSCFFSLDVCFLFYPLLLLKCFMMLFGVLFYSFLTLWKISGLERVASFVPPQCI